MSHVGPMHPSRNPSAGGRKDGARFRNRPPGDTGSSINVPAALQTADRIATFSLYPIACDHLVEALHL
jgi:hypothetical protein